MDERVSDIDIDPSFPIAPPNWVPQVANVFGSETLNDEEWLSEGPVPDFSSILRVQSINEIPGPWVLLDGYISMERADLNREVFTFLRGFFVRNKDVEKLHRLYVAEKYPGNHHIPDPHKIYYSFAGEAGASPRYESRLIRNGVYVRTVEEAFYDSESIPIEDGKEEVSNLTLPISMMEVLEVTQPESEIENDKEKGFFKIRLKLTPPRFKYRRIPGVKVELPASSFSWESYHSKLNQFSGFKLPTPSILQKLGLSMRDRLVDFFDKNGVPATLYRENGDGFRGDQHRLLYLREDLLKTYLKITRQKMVWLNWGERDWVDKRDDYASDPRRAAIFQTYKHIHKSFIKYSDFS